MTQRRHDPALHHLYGAFHLGLVLGLEWPRRTDAKTTVHREVVVSGVQIRVVTMRLGYAGFQIVGHRQLWNALKVLERMHMAFEPSLHLLIARGFSPSIGTGSERCHE